jgi:hypothetical protein
VSRRERRQFKANKFGKEAIPSTDNSQDINQLRVELAKYLTKVKLRPGS